MDYTKLFRTRKSRQMILRTLSWIPDKTMLKFQYRIKTGRKLNLKNPQRYTEKLQWYKLYYRNPLMLQCCDKYDVREYVESKGLGSILNECYGVFDNSADIDFGKLPDQFVLKDTLGGGGNSVLICSNRDKFDFDAARERMINWLDVKQVPSDGREWPYYENMKGHRVIAEKYITSRNNWLIDYKLFCFYGKICMVYVIGNRTMGGHGELAIMDADFVRMPCSSKTQQPMQNDPSKPENYDEMKRIAEVLSSQFPHVRVDLYNEGGRIIFGELTFFGASGYQAFEPDEFDFLLGRKFYLPEKT